MSSQFSAKAVAGHELSTDHEGITTALKVQVRVTAKLSDFKVMRAKPLVVIEYLWLSLGILEPAGNKAMPINQTGIGSKDEVGQRFHRFHCFDRCTSSTQVGDEIMPLFLRQVFISCILCMHPGVDFIENPEVVRWTHEIAATPREWACFSRGINIFRRIQVIHRDLRFHSLRGKDCSIYFIDRTCCKVAFLDALYRTYNVTRA